MPIRRARRGRCQAKSADNTGCLIEHFGNADAVPQLPERCLSRKAGIVRCCLKWLDRDFPQGKKACQTRTAQRTAIRTHCFSLKFHCFFDMIAPLWCVPNRLPPAVPGHRAQSTFFCRGDIAVVVGIRKIRAKGIVIFAGFPQKLCRPTVSIS